jgi:peptidoglycan/LPS O-acetylase OafA/YrhL
VIPVELPNANRAAAVPLPGRSVALDTLRGVAILLVLCHHQSAILNWGHAITWSGVDLFFVLSGYLVTGLLVKEHLTFGGTRPGLFLARRAFKIYPPFWTMIAVTVLFSWINGKPSDERAILCELLFLQNYGPGLWAITWSLAVEEHFYFLVAALFAFWNRRQTSADLPSILRGGLILLVGILIVRCLMHALLEPRYKLTYLGTHVRLDALVCGALIAFARHHARHWLAVLVNQYRGYIVVASGILLASVFMMQGRVSLVRTVGYTLTYLAYAGVLLLVLHSKEPTSLVARVLARIGRYSYGIYLWHLPILVFALRPVAHLLPPSVAEWGGTFFVCSIVGGALLTHLVELPMLALRDRWFPSRTGQRA